MFRYMYICMCVCARVCARACVYIYIYIYKSLKTNTISSLLQFLSFIFLGKSHAFAMVFICRNYQVQKQTKKLLFDKHIYDLSKETNRRISESAGVFPFMVLSKTKLLMNVFFHVTLQLFSCDWDVSLSQKQKNVLFKKCLRAAYND